MSKNKKIILTALLLAMEIVLSRFLSIKTPIVKISFAFLPIMLCATWLGAKWSVLLCVVADLIGATLFPTGPFFPGYTISTGIAGLIYGLLLYKEKPDSYTTKQFVLRVILSVVLVNSLVYLGLNTIWTSITSDKAVTVIFLGRAVKELIMGIISIVLFLFVEKILQKPFDEYIRSNDD